MRKILIGLMVLALVGVVGCKAGSANPVPTEDQVVYESIDYDFQLVFPETWGKYVADQRINPEPGSPIDKMIKFMTRENTDWYAQVYIVPKDRVLEAEALADFDYDKLGENEDFAFYWEASEEGETKQVMESFKAL